LILVAALIVTAVLHWAALRIVAELKAARENALHMRAVALMQVFAPGIAASAGDPRALLTWQPLAKTARQLCPAEFAALDRAGGGTFPFTKEHVQAAHAEWTASWLAWERVHDAEYKLKAAEIEHELGEMSSASASPFVRARFDAIEREKLDRYQRRYEEYVRVSKGLKNLES
jgi:hypothetical protein